MNKTFSDKNNGIDYTLVGEVYLPNLISTETNYEIGVWGKRHLEYIKSHRKVFYTLLLTNCKLNSYLHDVDIRATEMYDRLIKQLKDQQGITEQLKSEDLMAWVQVMNNISNQAREILNNEVIYTDQRVRQVLILLFFYIMIFWSIWTIIINYILICNYML